MDEKEQAKHEAEHYRLLVEGATDYAIYMLDPEGHVVSWNAGAERIKGYGAEEIIGRHFSQFYPPEALGRDLPAHELRVAKAKGRFEDEGWRVRKDGTQFWANVVITALRDESGTLRGFAKVTRDLTERKLAEENARRALQEEGARKAAESSAQRAQQAEEEERRHREQLKVTLTSIGDGVIVTDMKAVVTFMNPVAVSLTGWEPQEAAGKPLELVFCIVNEETRQPVENPVYKVLREGVVVGLANHTILIARDGREVPIDDSGAPIRGEDGAIAGVVLVFRDVTEARRAIATSMHLAAIVESSDDAIISKDLAGNITSWNRGAQRLYGYTAEEILGKPLALLVAPDHPDELPALLERIKHGERIDHFETVRVRKDGRRLNVSLTISPIKNADGKVIGASKIARDITAAKRQQAALSFMAEASKLLGELLDVSSTLQRVATLAVPRFADWCTVDMLEADGSIKRLAVAHVDPAKVALSEELRRRFPPDPSSPRGLANILRTGVSELAPEITDDMLAATIQEPELLDILRALGLRSYMGVPLTVRGKVLGAISFIAAESGRRYDAQDLAVAEELASRAAVAIENARLYQEVREADRRKDEFLATLAHELRNPLAPIQNSLEILKMRQIDPEVAKRTREMMERQVHHLVRLVDDLLDVSRVMRGKIELRKEPVELATAVVRAVETAQSLIEVQGHQLDLSLSPDSLLVDVDPVRLAQVIGNLLTNACKYTEAHGHIWLSVERSGEQAVLRIRDNGIGIAAELLPHVFGLFVQADHATTRSQGGLGIGLTLVKNLVEMHGGSVAAHSEGRGKGSEFVVCLPLASCEREQPTQHDLEINQTSSATGHRLLVVDDNKDSANSLAMLLRLRGHQVQVAYDGPTALQLAESFRPQVVFLDVGMPEMDGYEVARRMRKLPGLEQTVLAALTGWGQEEDRRRTTEAGFNYHFIKPAEPKTLEKLFANLNRVL